MVMITGDANGLRACEVCHAAQDAYADGSLGRLRVSATPAPTITRERFKAGHRVLRKRAPMVAAALLPFATAELCDRIDGVVAPCRAGGIHRPMNCAFARRNRGRRAARGDCGVTRPGVAGLITNDIGPLVDRDRVKPFSQDVTVGNVLVCHQRGAQLAGVRVKRKMHLAPRATPRVAMLTHLPFAFAIGPNACAVDHQMERLAVPDDWQLDLGRPRAAAHRRAVRHGQGGESLVAQVWRAAPRRARRQAEHALETRQRLNQRVAVEARATAPGLRVGCARTGGFIDPHRDVTSVDQASVVATQLLTR
ncbi:hypothetical protein BTI_4137 [Burkholderia thailandensis MSMB121]|nr:hypothetical protein BTI_4137 [Burkholderia thailandensis MSMB121]